MTPARMAARASTLAVRRGGPVVLRLTYKSTSPPYAPNPPTLINPVIDTSVSTNPPGTISIRANSAVGRLLAGDALTINGVVWTLLAPANARPPKVGTVPGFDALSLSALPAVAGAPTAPDGTPVQPVFQNDFPMTVPVIAFPIRLVDGERIKSQDVQVLIPAVSPIDGTPLPRPPDVTDMIGFQGTWLVIVDVTPAIARGVTISYRVHAR